MITLKSEFDLQTLLDKPSFGSIVDLIMKDSVAYVEKFGAKGNEWISRTLVAKGSDHKGSKIPYGFWLQYQFCPLPLFIDIGIREIRLAESMDDFLDLYNEFQKDTTMKNIQKWE